MKFNSLIPELTVLDIDESKRFYLDILGFKLEYERVADKFAFLSLGDVKMIERVEDKFCFLELDGCQLMIEEINDNWNTGKLEYPFGRGINFQIEVTNIEEIKERLIKNNISLFRDLTVSEYECNGEVIVQKEFLVQDVNGYLLRFCCEEGK